MKLSKQRPLLLQCTLKAEVWNLLRGGMDLTVTVSRDFMSDHPLSLSDIGHILSHAASYGSIPKPGIVHFDFTLGLRG